MIIIRPMEYVAPEPMSGYSFAGGWVGSLEDTSVPNKWRIIVYGHPVDFQWEVRKRLPLLHFDNVEIVEALMRYHDYYKTT